MTKDEFMKKLESHIIDNGVVTIDSVFRFNNCDNILREFLNMCKERKCTVKFVHEGLICKPHGHLVPEDYNGDYPITVESKLIATVGNRVMYPRGPELAIKEMEYILHLKKNEDWIKGSNE